jgi:hypothetical protein
MTHLSKKRLNPFHQILEYDSTFKWKVVCKTLKGISLTFFQYDSSLYGQSFHELKALLLMTVLLHGRLRQVLQQHRAAFTQSRQRF